MWCEYSFICFVNIVLFFICFDIDFVVTCYYCSIFCCRGFENLFFIFFDPVFESVCGEKKW